jgi:septum formation protein
VGREAEAARIILASSSPRRRRLLERIGLPHQVQDSGVHEQPDEGESATEFALRAAQDKARAVAAPGARLPVLGADTVVELHGCILGKPATAEDAAAMLSDLAGRTHRVHTAIALEAGPDRSSLVDTAVVHFSPMSRDQIQWYVATGEAMDKAGAYAIQGLGGLFVRAIEGSPHTVVGLPTHRLAELFQACGLDLWDLLS